MSKKGCSPDNSACEGFFGHLKAEMFYGIVSLPFTQILITMDMDLPLSISCLVPEIKSAHYKLSGDGWEFTQKLSAYE